MICAGWPCQDLSVAGKRAGLIEGERSSLFFQVVRIIKEMQDAGIGPAFAVFENVPGLLSSNGGGDFAVVLASLAECGAVDIAWRILDSQYFGVAQRRRRVFIVVDFRGESASEILAISEGLRGHPAPSREAREGSTESTKASPLDGDQPVAFTSESVHQDGTHQDGTRHPLRVNGHAAIAFDTTQITSAANRSNPKAGDPCHPIAAGAHAPAIAFTSESVHQDRTRHPLRVKGHAAIAFEGFHENLSASVTTEGIAKALRAGASANYQGVVAATPRRLTPVECERLQGFPDDWTRYYHDGKEVADGPRYRMLGNAVTVNVAEWIGHRLMMT